MPLQLDTLTQELRTRLGDPSEAALPPSQVDAALGAAIREYSRYRPLHQNIVLTTTKDVDAYPLPAGCLDVEDIWLRAFSSAAFDIYNFVGTAVPYTSLNALAGFGFTRPPTDFAEDLYRAAFVPLADAFWHAEVDPAPDPPQLRVTPVPNFQAELLMYGHFARPLASIPVSDAELLLLFARGDCLEYIGTKRSKSVERIPTATGTLKLSDGADLRAEGTALKADFRRQMGGGVTVLARG